MEDGKQSEPGWDCGGYGHCTGDSRCKQPGAGPFKPAATQAKHPVAVPTRGGRFGNNRRGGGAGRRVERQAPVAEQGDERIGSFAMSAKATIA